MSDNAQMSKSASEYLRVVAVVQFNHGEALVLNRAVQFVYEQVGNDFVGKDGPFRDYLYYSRGGSAFAGRELSLTMSDGSVKTIKDHWWHGTPKGSVDVPIGDIESLRKCYVFYSGSLSQDDFLALRSTYTGCVYPYWDYEKVIKHKDILGRYAHASGRCDVLVKEVKKKHLEAEGLRAKVAALEELAAQMYQIAGALGASVEVMDNLHAAAAGEPIPHKLEWPQEVERIQRPLFWYRKHSDGGGYDGPIHDSQIEPVRRESGAWEPLFAVPDARLEKAEQTLSRAGFVLNELYGEWKPPVNQVAAELRGRVFELEAQLQAAREQKPVAWYIDDDEGREYNGRPEMSDGRTGIPLYANPIPAEPVNARLVEALKRLERAAFSREISMGDPSSLLAAKAELADAAIHARAAIAAAEAQHAEPALPANKTRGGSTAWLQWALHIIRNRCPDVLTSHQYDCAAKAMAAGFAAKPVRLTDEQIERVFYPFGASANQLIIAISIGRAVELLALRANGYKVEG